MLRTSEQRWKLYKIIFEVNHASWRLVGETNFYLAYIYVHKYVNLNKRPQSSDRFVVYCTFRTNILGPGSADSLCQTRFSLVRNIPRRINRTICTWSEIVSFVRWSEINDMIEPTNLMFHLCRLYRSFSFFSERQHGSRFLSSFRRYTYAWYVTDLPGRILAEWPVKISSGNEENSIWIRKFNHMHDTESPVSLKCVKYHADSNFGWIDRWSW